MKPEELRAEARQLGYSLVKQTTYDKLARCRCGGQPMSQIALRGKYYRCTKCKYESPKAKYKYQAIKNWNNAVQDIDSYEQHRLMRTAQLCSVNKPISSYEELLVEVKKLLEEKYEKN